MLVISVYHTVYIEASFVIEYISGGRFSSYNVAEPRVWFSRNMEEIAYSGCIFLYSLYFEKRVIDYEWQVSY